MSSSIWTRWFRLWTETPRVPPPRPPRRRPPSPTSCPHCTNVDTLTLHCPDGRCGWTQCTCGALIYAGRRHRHPRHGSRADTCHDPVAAA